MRPRTRSGQSGVSDGSPSLDKQVKVGRTITQSTVCPDEEISPRERLGSTDYSDAGDSISGFSPPGGSTGISRVGRTRLGSFLPPTINEQEHEEEEEQEEAAADGEGLASNRVPQATPGSVMHSVGECRPCAWFHKSRGCQNGADCRHCHLCPDGELKNRKKTKVQALRVTKEDDQVPAVEQPRSIPTAQTQQLRGDLSSMEPQKIELRLPKPEGLPLVLVGGDPAALDMPSPPPGLAQPKGPLASKGSASHGTGECRPCAWFYKPQGCQNAAECRHCHLCPEGEIKTRRKVKSSKLRSQRGDQEDGSDSESDDSSLPQKVRTSEGSEVVKKVSLPFPSKQGKQIPLPSPGSALHGTGECRPCAWFHKPQGCSNADQCRHCHLCDEGEIRDRRKVKLSGLKRQNAASSTMEQAMWMVQKQQEVISLQWQAQALWAAAWAQQPGFMPGFVPDGSPTADDEDDEDDDEDEEEEDSKATGSPYGVYPSSLCTR